MYNRGTASVFEKTLPEQDKTGRPPRRLTERGRLHVAVLGTYGLITRFRNLDIFCRKTLGTDEVRSSGVGPD